VSLCVNRSEPETTFLDDPSKKSDSVDSAAATELRATPQSARETPRNRATLAKEFQPAYPGLQPENLSDKFSPPAEPERPTAVRAPKGWALAEVDALILALKSGQSPVIRTNPRSVFRSFGTHRGRSLRQVFIAWDAAREQVQRSPMHENVRPARRCCPWCPLCARAMTRSSARPQRKRLEGAGKVAARRWLESATSSAFRGWATNTNREQPPRPAVHAQARRGPARGNGAAAVHGRNSGTYGW
jgi:hypothetical protein